MRGHRRDPEVSDRKTLCQLAAIGAKQQGKRWQGAIQQSAQGQQPVKNCFAQCRQPACRQAGAIGNLKEATPLRDFFHRVNFRKGRVSAISATARKLAVIIWNMVVKGVPYVNPEGYLYLDQKRKLGLVKRIKKQIDKFGLTNEDIGFVNA